MYFCIRRFRLTDSILFLSQKAGRQTLTVSTFYNKSLTQPSNHILATTSQAKAKIRSVKNSKADATILAIFETPETSETLNLYVDVEALYCDISTF